MGHIQDSDLIQISVALHMKLVCTQLNKTNKIEIKISQFQVQLKLHEIKWTNLN